MLRFQPDRWLEGLLRPLILGDPSSGIYFEQAAPDWRFFVLAVFVFVAWWGRRRLSFGPEQNRALLLMLVAFYVWTFVSGNARYFSFGLLLVGPLLVMAWRHLPGSKPFRWTMLVLVVGLQVSVVVDHYRFNRWGLVRWFEGSGLGLEDSPLRHRPAVFLTATGISYSILVPAFHPESRWANLAGQRDITPELPEFERLQRLLASGLPRYLVAPISPRFMDAEGQPVADARRLYSGTLAAFGLDLGPGACVSLRSTLAVGAAHQEQSNPPKRGFWICPVHAADHAGTAITHISDRTEKVFSAIESRCPRFFQPGDGRDRQFDGLASRHYVSSDMTLYLTVDDRVLFRYFRSLNSSFVGTGSEVLVGRFELPCDKVPGRYRAPWSQD